MLSFWCGFGSNYIGGTGSSQSNLAWRLPTIIQGIPAILLALGIWLMPFSPRWLIKKGRDEKAIKTLAWLRKLPNDHELIRIEYLEIKAECLFEDRAFERAFPNLSEKQRRSTMIKEVAQYVDILRTWDNFKRVSTAWLVMFFQYVLTSM